MKIKIERGIYDDGHAYVVRAAVGTGKRLIVAPEIRVPKTRPLAELLPELRAAWHREKMRLNAEHARTGGKITRGTLAHDVDRYFELKEFARPQLEAERRLQLAWWVERLGGHRTRAALLQEPNDLRRALNGLKRSASTRNKYRTALSNLYTVLDGKNAPNPFRDVLRDDEGEPARRDQPYELIDAIIAHVRDRGRAKTLSKTKARIMVLAFAPVTPAQAWTLTRDCVDFERGILYTPGRHKGAGTRGQGKPLTADALAAFRAFDAAGCWGIKAARSSLWRTFTRARDAAIAELSATRPDVDLSRAADMRPYDLRHSLLTMVLRSTGDLEATKAYADHESTSTTLRYAQGAVSSVLAATGSKVAAAFASRPAYRAPAPQAGALDSPTKLPNYDPATRGIVRKNADFNGVKKTGQLGSRAPRLSGNRRIS